MLKLNSEILNSCLVARDPLDSGRSSQCFVIQWWIRWWGTCGQAIRPMKKVTWRSHEGRKTRKQKNNTGKQEPKNLIRTNRIILVVSHLLQENSECHLLYQLQTLVVSVSVKSTLNVRPSFFTLLPSGHSYSSLATLFSTERKNNICWRYKKHK